MDIKVYGSVRSVRVNKVYVSEYSKPWVSEDKFDGNDKFFRAYRELMMSSPNDIVSIKMVGDYDIENTLTLTQLMAFFAYELMTHGVVLVDEKFHRHSTGFGKDDVVVNGIREPAERLGYEPRTAFNDGLRHFNQEQADASEKASAEFWAKVEEMKEGKQ
jgi:hypothetical protein